MEVKGRESFKEGVVWGAPCRTRKVGQTFGLQFPRRQAARKGPEGLLYPQEKGLDSS